MKEEWWKGENAGLTGVGNFLGVARKTMSEGKTENTG
jgi:hypothetical protein